jgi:hypothetical protein
LRVVRRRRSERSGKGGLRECKNSGKRNRRKDRTEHLTSPVLANRWKHLVGRCVAMFGDAAN